jgi:diacylglycerol kinase family enzyme
VLIVNPGSGRESTPQDVLDAARVRGIETLLLDEDARLDELAREAVGRGADVLGVAGGDGSLGVVAAAAREAGIAFVCVPTGTRNHFAADVGVVRGDAVGALDAFTDGVERRIDVGEANGRLFLNNVSLGVYGDAVQRPEYRSAKLRTLLATVHEELRGSRSAAGIAVVDDQGDEHRDPGVVLVSNNPYDLDPPLRPGGRAALDGGRLGVIVLETPRSPLTSRSWTTHRLTVEAPATVAAGIDGEAAELTPPLELAIRPRALRVRIAARHARSNVPDVG